MCRLGETAANSRQHGGKSQEWLQVAAIVAQAVIAIGRAARRGVLRPDRAPSGIGYLQNTSSPSQPSRRRRVDLLRRYPYPDLIPRGDTRSRTTAMTSAPPSRPSTCVSAPVGSTRLTTILIGEFGSGTTASVKGFGRRPLVGRSCELWGRRSKASQGGNRGDVGALFGRARPMEILGSRTARVCRRGGRWRAILAAETMMTSEFGREDARPWRGRGGRGRTDDLERTSASCSGARVGRRR